MPMPDHKQIHEELEERMALVRRVTNLGRSLRAKHQIKTRQALPSIMVITRRESDQGIIESGADVIRQELNVKAIEFSTDEARFVRLGVKPNLRTLGKRLGAQLNTVRQALEQITAQHETVAALLAELESKGAVNVAGFDLSEDDFLIERGPKDDRLIATGGGVTVLLDTQLTEELVREGLAREVINRVQRLRKDSGLNVSDRIELFYESSGSLAQSVESFRDYICEETLAVAVRPGQGPASSFCQVFEIEQDTIKIWLRKV
jgi:isoleucyl-tRNA synthetase